MGTNYYLYKIDGTRFHIGKASGGWAFSLHVIPELGINDLPDWVELFKPKTISRIEDEYGGLVSPKALIRLIETWANPHESSKSHKSVRDWTKFHVENRSMIDSNGYLRSKLDERCIKHGENYDCFIGEFS